MLVPGHFAERHGAIVIIIALARRSSRSVGVARAAETGRYTATGAADVADTDASSLV
jgi:hypothetical protein